MLPLHLDILPPNQLALLPILTKLKSDWYLAGGTALSLQIGHRESIDFDFFCENSFDTKILFEEVQNIFPQSEKSFEMQDTLYVTVNGVKVSFIKYQYPLIRTAIETPYFRLASIPDIATMKLSAIQDRKAQKDYVDLYHILQQYSFKELFRFYNDKFGTITSSGLLRKYLTYFDDIEVADIRMHTDISWEEMKQGLIEKAIDFGI